MSSEQSETAAPSRGGRPSREAAEQIRERILDVATELFLAEGYAVTSIEAVAQRVRMSKRTFYHRFRDKAELFDAVIHRILARLRPGDMSRLFEGGSLEEILLRLARLALRAAVMPEAIALQRMVIAEAPRFPELMAIVTGEGTRQQAIAGISALLQRKIADLSASDAQFAAEQFLIMAFAVPQRRAMGMGIAMTEEECDSWARDTVRLFLHGIIAAGSYVPC